MIRPATEADRAAILALHVASWRDAYGPWLPPAVLRDVVPGYLDAKWAPRTFGAGEAVLVDAVDGALAGFVCAVWAEGADLPLIDNLHVRPGLRAGGTGGRLLTALKAALRDAGFARAWLTVLDGNDGALRFYLRHGGGDEGTEADMLVGQPVVVRRIGFDLRA